MLVSQPWLNIIAAGGEYRLARETLRDLNLARQLHSSNNVFLPIL
jgi:hypothetical protein